MYLSCPLCFTLVNKVVSDVIIPHTWLECKPVKCLLLKQINYYKTEGICAETMLFKVSLFRKLKGYKNGTHFII